MTSDDDFDHSRDDDTETSDEQPRIAYKYVPCPRSKSILAGGTGDVDEDDAVVDLTIVGNANVGKTSILKRFASQLFDGSRIETPGVDYFSIRIMTGHPNYNVKTTVKVADTAGQERYASLIPARLRHVFGIFIVFDASDRDSYDSCSRWAATVDDHNDFCCRMLVANKIDLYNALPQNQQWMENVNWEDECQRLRCVDGFFSVSAKDGNGINAMMVDMVHRALQRQKEVESEALAGDKSGKNSYTLQINNNISVSNKKTCKC